MMQSDNLTPKSLLPVVARVASIEDAAFVIHAWTSCLSELHPYKKVPKAFKHQGLKDLVQSLIDKSEVYVLCAEDDPSNLYSFIAFERKGPIPIIHFAYTKSIFWRMGLMKQLILEVCPEALDGSMFTTYSNIMTADQWKVGAQPFQAYLEKQYGIVYNPFAEA